jgi:hypothetical protein
LVDGAYRDANYNVANFWTEAGPVEPTPPTDQFNFANFTQYNFYYGTVQTPPYRGAGRNFNARNFRGLNFRVDAWAFMDFNFNSVNFQTEIFSATVYPAGSFRSRCFNPANFKTDTDYIDVSLPAVLLSITGDILVNIGAKTIPKDADAVTLTPNDILLLNATR